MSAWMSNAGRRELGIPGADGHCLRSVWFVCVRTGIWAVGKKECNKSTPRLCSQGLCSREGEYFYAIWTFHPNAGWSSDGCGWVGLFTDDPLLFLVQPFHSVLGFTVQYLSNKTCEKFRFRISVWVSSLQNLARAGGLGRWLLSAKVTY